MTDTIEYVKSVDVTDTHVEIVVRGVPFGGPDYLNNRDLHGEYFSEKTFVGLPEVNRFYSYFEHNKDDLFKSIFGDEPIGYAERMDRDDTGWLYKIYIDRRKKYANLLHRLAEAKALDASTTPFQRGVRKSEDGHWDLWPVTEVALTVNPANPLAEQIIQKSLADLGDTELQPRNTQSPDETPEQTGETPEEVTTPEQETNAQVEDLAAQIEKAFGVPSQEDGQDKPTIYELVSDVNDRITKLNDRISNLEKSMSGDFSDLKQAFPELARQIANALRGAVAQESRMSDAEKSAVNAIQNGSGNSRHTYNGLPANAPGNF